jgi:hypothetical protein
VSVAVKPETKTTRTNEWMNEGATTISFGSLMFMLDEKMMDKI